MEYLDFDLEVEATATPGVYQVSGWSFELRGPDDPPGMMKVSLMTKGE